MQNHSIAPENLFYRIQILGYVLSLFFLPSLYHPFLSAQETVTGSSISGRVMDPSGAVMENVDVQIRNLQTSQTFLARTSAQGRYRFSYLPVGEYEMKIHQRGFAEVQKKLRLTIASAFDVSITLSLASETATVQADAEAPVLETNRSEVAQTVEQAEIGNLPFNGRNILDLALLLPGVSPTNTGSSEAFAETSAVAGQGYSVNSQRNFSNSFIVDGLSSNDDAAGLAGNTYSMDVVQEFQVVTAGGQAEFGRAMSGYLNIITKSGSNAFHGTGYGFLRNQRLNAKNPLSHSSLPMTQAQYGASLSGPFKKDRAFLFGNFEQRRLNSNGIITIKPLDAEAINQRLIAVGYKAPLLPLSSTGAVLYPTTIDSDMFFIRTDRIFSNRDQLTLRYSIYQLDSRNSRGIGGLAAVSYGSGVQDSNHTLSMGNVATLSPRLINESRAQVSYDDLNAPPTDLIGPSVTIAGTAQFGRYAFSPTARLNYLFEAVDNLSLQAGNHTVKAGTNFLWNSDKIAFPQSIRGTYTFSSLKNFLSGIYNNQGYTQSFGMPEVRQQNPNLGFYTQDEWRATSALTLNLGVRYDLQFLRTLKLDANNISPRIGFAWTPWRSSRTVLRGSYGLFYDRIPLRSLANALLYDTNSTDRSKVKLQSYTFSPTQSGAPIFPSTALAPPVGALLNFTLMNPSIQNAYAHQISLEVEQQLSSKSSLSISYQHLRGIHLLMIRNTNINPDGSRPDPTIGNRRLYDSMGDSYYDGLSLSATHKPVSWGTFRLSYTFSKAINDVTESFFSAAINNFSISQDRSLSDDDQRNRLVLNTTLAAPLRTQGSLSQNFLSGWRLSTILQYYSSLPFSIVTGTTTKQSTTQRPCTGGWTLTANGGNNPCTRAEPGAVIGRNTGVGFDSFSINSRISRTFFLKGRMRFETLVEAFNLLNHRNQELPNSTWGTEAYPTTPADNFGQATAAGDPRSLQIAARIIF